MRFSARFAYVLLVGFALGLGTPKAAAAQATQQSATSLVGKHPSQLTRHPQALAALQQALGARFSTEEDLIWGVGSGMTLIARRYLVGVSMAPSSGGDPDILIAYDIVARAAYLARFGTISPPGGPSRIEVFSPSNQAIWPASLQRYIANWPASLQRYIANWRPEALPLINFADDATAALAAGPPPPPVAPPPRRWLVGLGQGIVLSIGNDEGAFFSFSCSGGHDDTSPSISLEVRSRRKAPVGRLLRVIIRVNGDQPQSGGPGGILVGDDGRACS
jgi:hypothetical protein